MTFIRSPGHTSHRVFKYRRSAWKTPNGLTIKETWTRLVRQCCQCEECMGSGPDRDAREADANEVDIRCDSAVDGGLYRAVFVPGARDHETGNVEEWHWRMLPLDDTTSSGKPAVTTPGT